VLQARPGRKDERRRFGDPFWRHAAVDRIGLPNPQKTRPAWNATAAAHPKKPAPASPSGPLTLAAAIGRNGGIIAPIRRSLIA
jgi:hypothetical protein